MIIKYTNIILKLDISDSDSCSKFASKVEKDLGHLDILINNVNRNA